MEQPRAWTDVAPVRIKEMTGLAETSAMPAAVATDFESAVHEHARLVFKVAYSVVRNVEDAEDCVQETFLRAYRSGDLPQVQEPKAWLARIAWRVAVDRVKRHPVEALEELAERGFEPASSAESADSGLIEDEKVSMLHKLMATLPEDLRQTLVLSTVEEMSSAAIGKVLGIPETSVRTRLFRARQLLKEKLASMMEGKNGK
jgi:RNA polymerase sigma-70 factor (ECF subfamily)